jgi:hypothetical protein
MHQLEYHRIGVPFTNLEAENAQASDNVVKGRSLNYVDIKQTADYNNDDSYVNIAD